MSDTGLDKYCGPAIVKLKKSLTKNWKSLIIYLPSCFVLYFSLIVIVLDFNRIVTISVKLQKGQTTL